MPRRARVRERASDPVYLGAAADQPDRGCSVVVLPQEVGLAVAVEVGRVPHMPRRARIGERRTHQVDVRAVHPPHRRRAVGVLPQDVRLAAGVEIVLGNLETEIVRREAAALHIAQREGLDGAEKNHRVGADLRRVTEHAGE